MGSNVIRIIYQDRPIMVHYKTGGSPDLQKDTIARLQDIVSGAFGLAPTTKFFLMDSQNTCLSFNDDLSQYTVPVGTLPHAVSSDRTLRLCLSTDAEVIVDCDMEVFHRPFRTDQFSVRRYQSFVVEPISDKRGVVFQASVTLGLRDLNFVCGTAIVDANVSVLIGNNYFNHLHDKFYVKCKIVPYGRRMKLRAARLATLIAMKPYSGNTSVSMEHTHGSTMGLSLGGDVRVEGGQPSAGGNIGLSLQRSDENVSTFTTSGFRTNTVVPSVGTVIWQMVLNRMGEDLMSRYDNPMHTVSKHSDLPDIALHGLRSKFSSTWRMAVSTAAPQPDLGSIEFAPLTENPGRLKHESIPCDLDRSGKSRNPLHTKPRQSDAEPRVNHFALVITLGTRVRTMEGRASFLGWFEPARAYPYVHYTIPFAVDTVSSRIVVHKSPRDSLVTVKPPLVM